MLNLPEGDTGTGGTYAIASRRLNGETIDDDVIADDKLAARNLVEIDLAPPRPMLSINAVWRRDNKAPAIKRLLETAKQLAQDQNWA